MGINITLSRKTMTTITSTQLPCQIKKMKPLSKKSIEFLKSRERKVINLTSMSHTKTIKQQITFDWDLEGLICRYRKFFTNSNFGYL